MSIAVSAVVHPSRRLRGLLAAFCAALCAAALAVGLLLPERFAGGAIVALAPLFAALLLGHSCTFLPAAATARRIDISGVGQLRVTVQQDMSGNGAAAELLPGATVWPGCMVLRLRVESGAVRTLLLLPDSVGRGQYRALAVAVRTLASGAAAGLAPGPNVEHKIL
jgi:toxin CptA